MKLYACNEVLKDDVQKFFIVNGIFVKTSPLGHSRTWRQPLIPSGHLPFEKIIDDLVFNVGLSRFQSLIWTENVPIL